MGDGLVYREQEDKCQTRCTRQPPHPHPAFSTPPLSPGSCPAPASIAKGSPINCGSCRKHRCEAVLSFLSPCHVYFVPFGVSLGLSIQFHSTGGVFTALFEPQSGCSLVTSSQVPQTLLCYKHSIHLLLSQLSPLKTQRSHLGLVQATIQSVVCQNLC